MAPSAHVKMTESTKGYKPRAIRTGSLALFAASTLAMLLFFAVCKASSLNGSDACSNLPPTAPGEPANSCAPAPSMFTAFETWSDSQYFTAAYLPTLLAVLWNIFWDVIYSSLKEMEPFFQLAKEGGVSVQESLSLRYTSASLPVAFYRSIAGNHPFILGASLISLVLTSSVPFASEVLQIGTRGVCNSTAGGSNCTPYVKIQPTIASLEIALAVIALFGALILAYNYYHRRIGIHSEGTSIVGLAVLLNNTPFVESLCAASKTATLSEAENALGGKFTIAKAQFSGTLSILQTSPGNVPEPTANPRSPQTKSHPVATKPQTKVFSKIPLVLRTTTVSAMMLILVGLTVLILYYRFVGTLSGFERFMDSQSIGVRFMMTSFGVLVKLYWAMLEQGRFSSLAYLTLTNVYQNCAPASLTDV